MHYLFLDYSSEHKLPETLLYTAGFLSKHKGVNAITIAKVESSGSVEKVLADCIAKEGKELTMLLWQQNWICRHGEHLLLNDARVLKQCLPESTIVVGGYLPTLSPELFIQERCFDIVLRGYPWASFEWLDTGAKGNDKIIECNYSGGFPENVLLEDGFSFAIDHERYFYKNAHGETCTSYCASYHCNNQCPFCFNQGFYSLGGGLLKPQETVRRDLVYLRETHGVSGIDVKDSNIFIDQQRGREILGIFQRNDIRITGNLDVMVKDITKEHIDLLEEVGVRYIFFGLESLEEKTRELLNKQFDLSELEELFRYGKEKGIYFCANVMLGLDKEAGQQVTKYDVEQKSLSIRALLNRHSNISVEMRLYMPLLGTTFGDRVWEGTEQRNGLTLDRYYGLIDHFVTSKKIPRSNMLPPCYDSHQTVALAMRFSRALASYNHARSINHAVKGRNSCLACVSAMRCILLSLLFKARSYYFIMLEKYIFDILYSFALNVFQKRRKRSVV